MATLTTSFMTQKDTMVKIKFRPHGKFGMSWEGKNYGPGGKDAGFDGGDEIELPAFWAARQIGNGRAELIDEGSGPVTPFDAIDNRDPVETRGRRGR